MMHSTLVLRLAGPLQSWGADGGIFRRRTMREPTKSGVLGLLAAAEGRQREETIDDLVALTMAVRTDVAGTIVRDYHLASDYRGYGLPTAAVNKAGVQRRRNARKRGTSQVTHRMYLSDAVFVVGLAGDSTLVERLAEAVQAPAYPLALGRRGCPPGAPVFHGVEAGEAVDVLRATPWSASATARRRHSVHSGRPAQVELALTVDDPDGTDIVHDVPTSFRFEARHFRPRTVRRDWIRVDSGCPDPDPDASGHDPFALIGW